MKKILIAFLILLILCSASGIAYIKFNQYSAQEAISNLRPASTVEGGDFSGGESEEFPFEEIKDSNADFFGWLLIPETKIDLPIMQNSGDPLFYLNHNFQGESDKNGLPFLDERNASDFSDDVTIVYGHNMQSGMIFHELELYKNPAYFAGHSIITIFTQNGVKKYQVLAFLEEKISAANSFNYNFYTSFETETEWESFLFELLEQSVHPVDMPSEMGALLILSTCDNISLDGRIAVVAYEIE